MPTFETGRTIWIARHGNRVDFVDRKWRDTAARPHDPQLSPDGHVQAQLLGYRLRNEPIRHLFASPFLRTLETASYVSEQLKLPIKIEPGAGEYLNPEWFKEAPVFLPEDDLRGRFPRMDFDYVSRGRSDYPEIDERLHCWPRAGATVRKLVEEFSGDLMIVCHGATMLGLAYGLVEGQPPIRCGLTCLIKIVWNGAKWEMVLNGCDSHLA